MLHVPGLAASSPVRYILEVERSGYSTFHLSSARCVRYSPECVEGAFSEVRLQDPAYIQRRSRTVATAQTSNPRPTTRVVMLCEYAAVRIRGFVQPIFRTTSNLTRCAPYSTSR